MLTRLEKSFANYLEPVVDRLGNCLTKRQAKLDELNLDLTNFEEEIFVINLNIEEREQKISRKV